jgi:hypothetical protein
VIYSAPIEHGCIAVFNTWAHTVDDRPRLQGESGKLVAHSMAMDLAATRVNVTASVAANAFVNCTLRTTKLPLVQASSHSELSTAIKLLRV